MIQGSRLVETTTDPSQPLNPTRTSAAAHHQTSAGSSRRKRSDSSRVARIKNPMTTPIMRLPYSVHVRQTLKRASPYPCSAQRSW